jgi:uncharacterized protein (DUF488 family)
MDVYTVGHGTRTIEDFLELLRRAPIETLVDVRRYPGSRRNPQFNRSALAETLAGEGIAYRHAETLGGRLSGIPGEERFACIRTAAFRSYAAQMATLDWQEALDAALSEPTPCFACAETVWWRCHRKLIAELLVARGHRVFHLLPDRIQPHPLSDEAEVRDGKLYLCGALVA